MRKASSEGPDALARDKVYRRLTQMFSTGAPDVYWTEAINYHDARRRPAQARLDEFYRREREASEQRLAQTFTTRAPEPTPLPELHDDPFAQWR